MCANAGQFWRAKRPTLGLVLFGRTRLERRASWRVVAQSRKSIENMVALTGVEPAFGQFSSVQLGLSSCVFGLVQFATRSFRAVRLADVLPRCCPAAKIRLLRFAKEFG
jgi:hypothetical protein